MPRVGVEDRGCAGLPPVPLPCGGHPVADRTATSSAWGQRSSPGLQSPQAQRRLAAACVTQSHLPPATGRAGWLPCSGSKVPSGDPRVVSLQLVREGDDWVEAVDSPGLCWEGGELRGAWRRGSWLFCRHSLPFGDAQAERVLTLRDVKPRTSSFPHSPLSGRIL